MLFQKDGSAILQIHKSPSTHLSAFSTNVQEHEEPIDAALRVITEETNLTLDKERLIFFDTRQVPEKKQETCYFGITQVDIGQVRILDGTHLVAIHDAEALETTAPPLLKEVLVDHFAGYKQFLFLPDINPTDRSKLYTTYLKEVLKGHQPSTYKRPLLLACTGHVASGKSTVTEPLAAMVDCVKISSDQIREMFFQNGFNFSSFRPFLFEILQEVSAKNYNIFLDLNIANYLQLLKELTSQGYQPFIIHANPPESFIKEKILSGNMKHELSFFSKDEYLYRAFLAWKDRHLQNLSQLKEEYPIWYEVDTADTNLDMIMKDMQQKFRLALRQLAA